MGGRAATRRKGRRGDVGRGIAREALEIGEAIGLVSRLLLRSGKQKSSSQNISANVVQNHTDRYFTSSVVHRHVEVK